MSARFEVIVNGERICVSGLDGEGVLSTCLTYVNNSHNDAAYELHVGGLGRYLPHQEVRQHAHWAKTNIGIGDEILIRLLPPGEFDPPQEMFGHPSARITDPDFGNLEYTNAWDGEISIDCSPISSAHVHLWSDKSGPTDSQRQRFREFIAKHADIWPRIAESLVRCHSEIESIDELIRSIVPRIGIEMRDTDDDVQISYWMKDDPEFRSYSVTLRNWEVVEVSAFD